jgi:hypothetical protein
MGTPRASGQECEEGWVEGPFGTGGVSARRAPFDSIKFDDGTGEKVYFLGSYTSAGNAAALSIVGWDGRRFHSLFGPGASDLAMSNGDFGVFDDGSGPALYVCGDIRAAGGLPISNVARWDGTQWSALGEYLGWQSYDWIGTVASGPAKGLYISGVISYSDFRYSLARWDGATWHQIDTGELSIGYMVEYDDGSGPALYFRGSTCDNSHYCSVIYRWDGSELTRIGAASSGIWTMTVFDMGDGPALYVIGDEFLTEIDGVPVNGVAKWDGQEWSGLGEGEFYEQGLGICGANVGGKPRIYVTGTISTIGGQQVQNIAMWDGENWASLGGIQIGQGELITSFGSGDDERVIVGGMFTSVGDAGARYLAQWDGQAWAPLQPGVVGTIYDLHESRVSGEPALYAAGGFTAYGPIRSYDIARWDGETWQTIGADASGPSSPLVNRLIDFDDAGVTQLVAGGLFTSMGGVPASHIARWDGDAWSGLGAGVSGEVRALAVFDDGEGDALYAGGAFQQAGGMPAKFIAKWDGEAWSPLAQPLNASVYAMLVFDDGAGSRLYAAGSATLVSGQASSVARWDGAAWEPLGLLNGTVNALCVHDWGQGPRLTAAGSFAGPSGLSRIAVWDGAAWNAPPSFAVGSGDILYSLASRHGPEGDELFAAGSVKTLNGSTAGRVLRWNGSEWSSLSGSWSTSGAVRDLALLDGAGHDSLFVAGGFVHSNPGYLSNNLAEYRLCEARCVADWDASGEAPNSSDFLAYLNDWSQAHPSADLHPPAQGGEPAGDGVWDSADFMQYMAVFAAGC